MAETGEAGQIKIAAVRCSDTPVMYAAAAGEWDSIPAAAKRAFERLEVAVPPRGRRLDGYWHPPAREFRAAYGREEDDDPAQHGFLTCFPGDHGGRRRHRSRR